MAKMLVSVSDELIARFRAVVPDGKRSKEIERILEMIVKEKEQELYQAAVELEKDKVMSQEMKLWENTTLKDGLEDETW